MIFDQNRGSGRSWADSASPRLQPRFKRRLSCYLRARVPSLRGVLLGQAPSGFRTRGWLPRSSNRRTCFLLSKPPMFSGLAVSVRLVLMTDLRRIEVTLRREPCLGRNKTTEGLDVERLRRLKLVFLFLAGVNALGFETTIGRSVVDWKVVPARAKFAGWASLICWTGVILFGRWTA